MGEPFTAHHAPGDLAGRRGSGTGASRAGFPLAMTAHDCLTIRILDDCVANAMRLNAT